ncbi:hypothetical protein Tco_0200358 [Tanacetum coccineum]
MFQQHQGESLSKAWTRFKDLLQKIPHHGIELWLQVQIFYDHVTPATRRTIDQSAGDVLSTSDCRLIELEHQVQRLMEAYIAPMQPTQVNNITSSCDICSGSHDTQYCMENLEQAFVDYASSRTNETRNEAKEEGNVKSNTTEYKDHEMTVEREEEFEEETEEEIQEEEEDSPKRFDTFPTIKELRLHYNWIMSKRLEPRRKPSNPKKICNFIGRVKGLKVFVGKCDFVVLEDTTSVMDHDLGSIVFRKPFVEATGLVYDKEEGTIADDDNSEKTHYSDSLDLGPEYKHDENLCRAIQSLIAMKAKRNKGEVTKFFKENKKKILSEAGDGVRIYPDGVIFDEKKLGSS